jgi:hypothetical protein
MYDDVLFFPRHRTPCDVRTFTMTFSRIRLIWNPMSLVKIGLCYYLETKVLNLTKCMRQTHLLRQKFVQRLPLLTRSQFLLPKKIKYSHNVFYFPTSFMYDMHLYEYAIFLAVLANYETKQK